MKFVIYVSFGIGFFPNVFKSKELNFLSVRGGCVQEFLRKNDIKIYPKFACLH